MLEEFVRRVKDKRCWLIIGEGCAHEEALKMKEMILGALPNAEFLFQKQINATLAINTGPGLVGVMTFVDP
jgi:fatty acid-binding protein DegV